MYANIVFIFNAALETHKRKTKNDLARIRSFPTFNLAIYPRLFSPSFDSKPPRSANPPNGDDRFTKWIFPTVNDLYSFPIRLARVLGWVNMKVFPREEFLV